MRLAFGSENSVDCLPSVGEHHPILRPEENRVEEGKIHSFPACLLELGHQSSPILGQASIP